MSDKKCCKSVWRAGCRRHTQCDRKGVVERDGKWYCKQHDPAPEPDGITYAARMDSGTVLLESAEVIGTGKRPKIKAASRGGQAFGYASTIYAEELCATPEEAVQRLVNGLKQKVTSAKNQLEEARANLTAAQEFKAKLHKETSK